MAVCEPWANDSAIEVTGFSHCMAVGSKSVNTTLFVSAVGLDTWPTIVNSVPPPDAAPRAPKDFEIPKPTLGGTVKIDALFCTGCSGVPAGYSGMAVAIFLSSLTKLLCKFKSEASAYPQTVNCRVLHLSRADVGTMTAMTSSPLGILKFALVAVVATEAVAFSETGLALP